MTIGEARRWLGIYFVSITGVTGVFLLMFSGTRLLPLTPEEATSSFQIIVPVLIGQLTVIFQWVARAKDDAGRDMQSPVPGWAVKLPPVVALIIIVISVVALCIANREGVNWSVSPETVSPSALPRSEHRSAAVSLL